MFSVVFEVTEVNERSRTEHQSVPVSLQHKWCSHARSCREKTYSRDSDIVIYIVKLLIEGETLLFRVFNSKSSDGGRCIDTRLSSCIRAAHELSRQFVDE